MIEHINAVENLGSILKVKGLDAILVGPYDLSASMGITGNFEEPLFEKVMSRILALCEQNRVSAGIHVVQPDIKLVNRRISEGYRFIAYSIDSVFLREAAFFKR
jgi:2-dehydro-3-deoxyglucarate aldolase